MSNRIFIHAHTAHTVSMRTQQAEMRSVEWMCAAHAVFTLYFSTNIILYSVLCGLRHSPPLAERENCWGKHTQHTTHVWSVLHWITATAGCYLTACTYLYHLKYVYIHVKCQDMESNESNGTTSLAGCHISRCHRLFNAIQCCFFFFIWSCMGWIELPHHSLLTM